MMMLGGSSWYPFTASQWQELELQALIFKYMASGIPVPPDLILSLRRNHFMDPQSTFPFIPHPPSIGWGMYQMGDARKAVDPEPGRCRRTDGKKWRCSKEAYPDSKYCERHMHRGKSRSRKPVELSLAANPPSSHFSSSNFSPLSLSTPPPNKFPFPCPSSSRHASLGHYSSQDVDDYSLKSRNIFALKEEVSEYPFFSETRKTGREVPHAEVTKEKYGHMHSTGSHYKIGLSGEEEKEKQYFSLGVEFKPEKGFKLEREEQPLSLRPFHCFLDENPPKVEGPWMNMDENQSKQVSGMKTQLSISITNHGMPVTAAPQCYNDS
ncbi:growth-regulating factor 1-like [Canna indica]|uniref:Growth-regulating factor n=1 Tax=Canna indica TaxID=4628 RepID=A0AAQ3QCZ0_9LILI|nr:growth-regulating factor 1-like [Canna indica]